MTREKKGSEAQSFARCFLWNSVWVPKHNFIVRKIRSVYVFLLFYMRPAQRFYWRYIKRLIKNRLPRTSEYTWTPLTQFLLYDKMRWHLYFSHSPIITKNSAKEWALDRNSAILHRSQSNNDQMVSIHFPWTKIRYAPRAQYIPFEKSIRLVAQHEVSAQGTVDKYPETCNRIRMEDEETQLNAQTSIVKRIANLMNEPDAHLEYLYFFVYSAIIIHGNLFINIYLESYILFSVSGIESGAVCFRKLLWIPAKVHTIELERELFGINFLCLFFVIDKWEKDKAGAIFEGIWRKKSSIEMNAELFLLHTNMGQ